jgi:5-formaminoimidazole-4-carboxamide-1-(beta)-D-ribofuranosyl 5'-monophosphate synthetase
LVVNTITREDVWEILEGYDPGNITVGSLGSHSALDISDGAKDEGLRTVVVCQKGREGPC